MDWVGSYNDPIYGGYIRVCVSDVNSVFYGQGVFSELGYMRGTIDPSTLSWTGNFWTAGIEEKHGSFNLTLASTLNHFNGSFSEFPPVGNPNTFSLTYPATAPRTSSSTPSDMDSSPDEEAAAARPPGQPPTGIAVRHAGTWLSMRSSS